MNGTLNEVPKVKSTRFATRPKAKPVVVLSNEESADNCKPHMRRVGTAYRPLLRPPRGACWGLDFEDLSI